MQNFWQKHSGLTRRHNNNEGIRKWYVIALYNFLLTPKQRSRQGKMQSSLSTPNSYERLGRIADNQKKFIKLGIAQSKQYLNLLHSVPKDGQRGTNCHAAQDRSAGQRG